MSKASSGDRVRVHYTGTLDSGQQFDSSEGRDPIAFKLGEGQVIGGFENAVLGMAEGESRKVTIPVEEAYGPRREEMVFVVPREQFPDDVRLEKGMRVSGNTAEGQRVDMAVIAFTDDSVTLDGNHPLAGEALTFEITLVDIG